MGRRNEGHTPDRLILSQSGEYLFLPETLPLLHAMGTRVREAL